MPSISRRFSQNPTQRLTSTEHTPVVDPEIQDLGSRIRPYWKIPNRFLQQSNIPFLNT